MDSGGLLALAQRLWAVEVGPQRPPEPAPSEEVCQEGNLGCFKSYYQMAVVFSIICILELGPVVEHVPRDPLAISWPLSQCQKYQFQQWENKLDQGSHGKGKGEQF